MLSRCFRKDQSAMAAVEFALIAPFMVLVFFATVELGAAVDVRARVTDVAATASDLVAQETSVSTSDMSNVFAALNSILYPYPSAPAQIVISSLVDNGRGATTVAWSSAQNATPLVVGATVSVPTGLITSGSGQSVILTQITYPYTPPLATYSTGTFTMTSKFYSRPRRSLTVTHS